MKTSDASQLPTFKAEPISGGKLRVTCPRRECGGTFWVRARAWRHRVGVKSAACPYCFRAAWVPDATSEPSKRIVKRRRS